MLTAVMPFGRFSISGDRNLPNQLYFIMATKLALLQGQEQVIADIKELVDDGKPIGYLFKNPHRISAEKDFLARKIKNATSSDKKDNSGRQAVAKR